ncbi:DUF397 domain-containing protein [Streptomyces sp. MAR4 CNX-425]|uniref:DUF397 domain-containing protein n=1 Tax=Streptomyces sp. MAR4 CNX-425 TaxID=3406343 RepID=UPI003B512648
MDVEWRKSSFSEQPDGNCLEVAAEGDVILVRESDEPNIVLRTTPEKLRAFLAGVKAGEFDHLT